MEACSQKEKLANCWTTKRFLSNWIPRSKQGAEQAIDSSIEHYKKKLAYIHGPQVVKTFK